MKKAITLIGMLVLAVSCSKSEPVVSKSIAAPAARPGQLAGKVAETFNSGGYTYLRVTTPSGDQWAAVPQTQVAKGDEVTLDVQMTMEKFESKTLNRTFDRIAFAQIAGPAAAAPPASTPSQHMQASDAGPISVEKPAGGKSVAEVWAEKESLDGKEVVVRGKVVKYLGGIMGRNWMHLQDGSGSHEAGNNDLTVTTDAEAQVGEIVTVKGLVAVDKDFGSGYRYAVIVEKATVAK